MGGFEEKEGEVWPPQALLSSNRIREDVAVRSKGQGKSTPPTIIAQPSVCVGSHTICGFASVCVIERMGSAPGVIMVWRSHVCGRLCHVYV